VALRCVCVVVKFCCLVLLNVLTTVCPSVAVSTVGPGARRVCAADEGGGLVFGAHMSAAACMWSYLREAHVPKVPCFRHHPRRCFNASVAVDKHITISPRTCRISKATFKRGHTGTHDVMTGDSEKWAQAHAPRDPVLPPRWRASPWRSQHPAASRRGANATGTSAGGPAAMPR
jgi:hypothetical protein